MILPGYSNPAGRGAPRSIEEERERFSTVESRNRWVHHSVGDRVVFVYPISRRLSMEPLVVLEVRYSMITDTLGTSDQQQIRIDPSALPWANSDEDNEWRMAGAFCLASQR